MKTIELLGLNRAAEGKKEVKALKRNGRIPCVIYGNGDNVHFSVCSKEVKSIIYTPNAYIIHFNIEGREEKVVMREVQYHPLTDNILHIDFYRVADGKPVVMDVPVSLSGVAEGVKQGGKLSLAKRKLTICGLIDALPDAIDVDVTSMSLGSSIFVKDISSADFTILTPASTAVCAVKMTRAARGAQAQAATSTPSKKK